ncbi:hypothetical protein DERP_013423 [Dermatophagoides pteronyssinus]|uniref:Uncharacterized protein n=1 Tax=Dermatophagoides pteronyssinus TaxID=6956 RepID=A0ABQ8JRM6_DERPT|nr:hypothetical protein DERP_013423 [Dermatophagoides pteronyssinus]
MRHLLVNRLNTDLIHMNMNMACTHGKLATREDEQDSKSNIADRYFDNGDVMFQFNSFFLRENFLKIHAIREQQEKANLNKVSQF